MLAAAGPLYMALPGASRGHAVAVLGCSTAALLWTVLATLAPRRWATRALDPLGVVAASAILSVLVAASGGGNSPLRALGLVCVVLGVWFYSRRMAFLSLTLIALTNLLPLVYDGGATHGQSLGWTVTLTTAFVLAGGVSLARASRLRTTVRLDAERLETIVALNREVEGAEFDVKGVVLDILDRARTLLGASAASAGVIEGDQIVYRYRTGPGRDAGEAITTPRDGSLSGICTRTGDGVYCEDSEHDPRVDKAACRKQGLRSMIIVPLRHRREVVGVLNVNSPDVRAFSPNDIRTVELIAGAISAAYGHAVDLAAKQELLEELEASVGALRDSEAKLSHQALHDPLTGLPNRTLLLDRLRTALAQRGDPEVAVLFVDLDGFKPVNDSLGHEAGDHLLVEAARRINQVLRQNDTAARLGGDEFAIICRDATQATAAITVAERLLETLEAPFNVAGREVFVTASIGIAAHDGTAEAMLRDADVAMYCAKAGGKAHYRLFETRMRTDAEARLERAGARDRRASTPAQRAALVGPEQME
ncbi:MAG: diguanylate cyclase domain-containing protein [Solirubrobacteraceae bacterium]